MLDASRALLAVLRGEVRTRVQATPSRIATVLLLAAPEGDLVRAAVDGLVRNRFCVDAGLIRDIYWSAPRSLRPSVAVAMGVSHVGASDYSSIWRDAFRSTDRTDEKVKLGQSLAGFLIRNPTEAERFANPIRRLLKDESVTVREVGLLLLATLRKASSTEIEQVARALSSGNASTRLAALGAAQRWLIRGDEVVPEVLAFARSEPVIAAARQGKKHRDSAVRMAARNYLRILRLRNAAWRAAGRKEAPATPSHVGSAGVRRRLNKTKSRDA